jgi:hypothetical protein
VAERENALLKEAFAALQPVSLSRACNGAITKAALVLLLLEYGRPCPPATRNGDHLARKGSLTHSSVDPLMQQVGVTHVPGVFPDHSDQQLTQRLSWIRSCRRPGRQRGVSEADRTGRRWSRVAPCRV